MIIFQKVYFIYFTLKQILFNIYTIQIINIFNIFVNTIQEQDGGYISQCQLAKPEEIELFNNAISSNQIKQFVNKDTLEIPCGVTQVKNQTQYYDNKDDILKIIIPDTVIEICDGAFDNLQYLNQVIIPQSVQTIGQYVFRKTNLTSIIIPDSVINIGKGAFQNCYKLNFVILTQNLEKISKSMFASNYKLSKITIPKSVQEIEESAFQSCTVLQCVAIQNKNCIIDNNAFYQSIYTGNIKYGEDQTCQDDNLQQCNEDYQYIVYEGGVSYCENVDTVNYYYENDQGQKFKVDNCNNYSYYISISKPYKCSQQCQEDYYFYGFQAPYQCSDVCGQGYAIPITGRNCTTQCIQYKNIYDDKNYCTEQCPYWAKYLVNQYSNVGTCNSTCKKQASTFYAIPLQGYTCDKTCKFYQNETEDNICVEQCSGQYPYATTGYNSRQCFSECQTGTYANDYTTPKQCAYYCSQPYQYIQQNKCQDGCTGDFASSLNQQTQCVNNCKYYTELEKNYCTLECPEQFLYQTTSESIHCLKDCENQQIYKYANENVSPKECTDNCQKYNQQKYQLDLEQIFKCVECPYDITYKYIYDQLCTDSCKQKQFQFVQEIEDKQYCYESCNENTWHEQQEKICNNNTSCENKQLKVSDTNQCLTSCPEGYTLSKENNLLCVKLCQDQQYILNNQCSDDCGQYTWQYNENQIKVCNDNQLCQENYQIIQENNNQCSLCPQTNSQFQYIKDLYCVDTCLEQFVNQEEDKQLCIEQCNQEAPLWSMNDKDQKVCRNDNKCQQDEFLIEDTKQCVLQCPPIIKYSQNGKCVEDCYENYARSFNQLSCDNNCMFRLLENTNIKQCTENIYCNNNEVASYYTLDRIQCVDKCVNSLNQSQIYKQGFECVQSCGDYVWYQYDGDNICRKETQCEENEKIIESTKECTGGCQGPEQYQQNDQCVEYCTGEYAQPYDDTDLVCDSTCTFEIYDQEQQLKKCVQDNNQCNNQQLQSQYTQDRLQCVQKCSQSLNQFNIYRKDNNCVSDCGNIDSIHIVWSYNNDNDRQCRDTTQCSQVIQPPEYLINDTYQCQQCQQNYNYLYDNQCIESCKEQNNLFVSSIQFVCVNNCGVKNEINNEQYVWYYDQTIGENKCTQEVVCSPETTQQFVFNQESECVQLCYGDYATPTTEEGIEQSGVCVQNCRFYYKQIQDIDYKFCTYQQDKCSEITNADYPYLNNVDSEECVSSCGQNEEQQNRFWYENQNGDKQCLDISNCEEFDSEYPGKYIQVDQTNQCIINDCYQKDFNIKQDDQYQCVEECVEEIWQYENDLKVCIQECLTALQIQTNECQENIQQCQENYHVSINYKNSQCQYIEKAENCQQYYEFTGQNQLYQMKDDEKLCTNCSEEGQKIFNNNNIQQCTKQMTSNGATIGIIVGVVACVVIIIVVTIIITKKRHINNNQIEMNIMQEKQSKNLPQQSRQ